jgi:trimethylguanosine synthase
MFASDVNYNDKQHSEKRNKPEVILNQVMLDDAIPSTYMMAQTILETMNDLIALVERTENNDDCCNPSIYDIPLQFGTTKYSKSRRRKNEDLIDMMYSFIDNEMNDFIHHFHTSQNIFLLKCNKKAIKLYGVCIGVGPSLPPLSHAIIRIFRNGKIETIEVLRSSKYMEQLNSDHKNYDSIINSMRPILNLGHLIKENQCPPNIHKKYWDQRYRLISKYDHGILLDDESWYSITPESIANHITKQCFKKLQYHFHSKINIVLDCFSGCGGNSISLAHYFDHVIAIDYDPIKTKYCHHNARLYQVHHKIEIVCEDVYRILQSMKNRKNGFTADNMTAMSYQSNYNSCSEDIAFVPPANVDLIVLSPPWGGPEYNQRAYFDLKTMITSGNGFELIRLAHEVCPNLVITLPRNVSRNQIKKIKNLIKTSIIVEEIYMCRKVKLLVLYIGDLFHHV